MRKQTPNPALDPSNYSAALADEMVLLASVLDTDDEGVIWRRSLSVLEWISRWEWFQTEVVNPNYLKDRKLTAEGRTTGALQWARGCAHHQQTLTQVVGTVEARAFDGPDKELFFHTYGSDGSAHPAAMFADGWVWAPRSALPLKADNHQRDDDYEELVAGRRLMAPLRTASNYLNGLNGLNGRGGGG